MRRVRRFDRPTTAARHPDVSLPSWHAPQLPPLPSSTRRHGSSSSPRTTCGPRRCPAAGPTGSRPTACRWRSPGCRRTATRVAWTSWRDGAPEVYVTDAEGGAARRLSYWADSRALCRRLDPGRRGARRERDGAGVRAADLGLRHPRRGRDAAQAGPRPGLGRRARRRRRPHRRRLEPHVAGDGLVEALPGRHGRQALVGRGTVRGSSSASAPSSKGSWARRWSSGPGRTGGWRSSPTTRAGATSTRSASTAPACADTPTTGPTARRRSTRAMRAPTASGSSTSRRGSCGSSTRSTRSRGASTSGSAGHAPRATRSGSARRASSRGRRRTGRGARASRSSAAPSTGSPTATARPARCSPSQAPGRGWPVRSATTGRCGWTTLDGEDAVCVAPLDERADGAAPLRRYGAGDIGRVLELAPAPDGSAVALAAHDGRLHGARPRGRRRA